MGMTETLETNALNGTPPEISWQTAFLILFGLALSAMIQPCGRFLGIQSKRIAWLRCSPFLCWLDTALIIVQGFYYVLAGEFSTQDAARRILQTRFTYFQLHPQTVYVDQEHNEARASPQEKLDIPNPAIVKPAGNTTKVIPESSSTYFADNTSLNQAQENIYLRLLVLVSLFYTSIWLLEAQGIPWTKFFAFGYMASILSRELLFWVAKPYNAGAPRKECDDVFTRRPGQGFIKNKLLRLIEPSKMTYLLLGSASWIVFMIAYTVRLAGFGEHLCNVLMFSPAILPIMNILLRLSTSESEETDENSLMSIIGEEAVDIHYHACKILLFQQKDHAIWLDFLLISLLTGFSDSFKKPTTGESREQSVFTPARMTGGVVLLGLFSYSVSYFFGNNNPIIIGIVAVPVLLQVLASISTPILYEARYLFFAIWYLIYFGCAYWQMYNPCGTSMKRWVWMLG